MFILIAGLFMLVGCKKEKEFDLENPKGVSQYNPEKYSKEIILTDETGENSVMAVIKSNHIYGIDHFVENSILKLKANTESETEEVLNRFKEKGMVQAGKIISPNNQMLNIEEKPLDLNKKVTEVEVVIETVNYNLMKDKKSFEIEIVPVSPSIRARRFTSGPVEITIASKSYADFQGLIVHPNWYPPSIIQPKVQWRTLYKPNWYNKYFNIDNGTISPNNWVNYSTYVHEPGSHKTQLAFWDVGGVNPFFPHATLVNLVSDFRGRSCKIGSYDGKNCHVGSAPSGTHAFIWGNAFYYTYASGPNKCPYPGSWDDSANCFVAWIPSGADPFIWSNNWYVKGDIIPL